MSSYEQAKIMRLVGEGALVYALAHAGWTEEQITNGLSTHYDAIAHELAEKIRESTDHNPTYSTARKAAQISENVGRLASADLIDSKATDV